jgi:hypothetical protein
MAAEALAYVLATGLVLGGACIGINRADQWWDEMPEPANSIKHRLRHSVGSGGLMWGAGYTDGKEVVKNRHVCAVCERTAKVDGPIPAGWHMVPEDAELMRRRRAFYESRGPKSHFDFVRWMQRTRYENQ